MIRSTLFIDESGLSSLAEIQNNPFILTGIILDDTEVLKIEGFFNYIKLKYGIDQDKPFHSYDIYEDPRQKIPDASARALSKTLADFISLIPIRIKVIKVDKEKFKKALGVVSNEDFKGDSARKSIKEFPYKISSSLLFKWFASYLKQKDRRGQIIVDSRISGDIELLKALNESKNPKLSRLSPVDQRLIKNRCKAICFAEKGYLSGGLEITDLISYTTYAYVRKKLSKMSGQGIDLIWNEIKERIDDQDVYELSDQEIKKFFKVDESGKYKLLNEYSH
jgi:hypothetical protein